MTNSPPPANRTQDKSNLSATPNGWTTTLLGDVTSRSEYGTSTKCAYSGASIPVLRIPNIAGGEIDTSDLKRAIANIPLKKGDELRNGDLLVCRTNGSLSLLGKAAVIRQEFESHYGFASYLLRFRFLEVEVLPRWIHLFFGSLGRRFIERNAASSAGQHNISLSTLHSMPLPLAPLNEQRRIISKIEELFSELDAGVAALTRAKANLKRYRASVLKAAVEGKLTEEWRASHPAKEPATALLARILKERRQKWEADQLTKCAAAGKEPPKNWREKYVESNPPMTPELAELPQGWCWASVQQVGSVQLGRQRAPQHHSGPHMRPYLRVANVFEDRIDTDDVMEMNFTPEEFETYRLGYGDILLNEGQSMELVGRPAMYRDEVPGACFTNTLVRFRANDGVDSQYALKVFLAYRCNGRFQKIATITVNIAHLGAGRFSEIEFPLPPVAEQKVIVEEVDRHFSLIDNAEKAIKASLARAARLRQSILKQAFEGKLVPQDPADEPARVLLDRLRAGHKSEGDVPRDEATSRRHRSGRMSPKRAKT